MIKPTQTPSTSSLATAVITVTEADQFPDHTVAWAVDLAGHQGVELRRLPELALPKRELPRPDEILLWLGHPFEGADAGRQEIDWPLLSSQEADKAGRFRMTEDRWSYCASHTALRVLLGDLLDRSPDEVEFDCSALGKPFLSQEAYGRDLSSALQFSISHTRGMVAVAISGSPVGVDVEHVRALPDMRELMDGMASAVCTAFDEAADEMDRQNLFFRYWTLAEAFIKATGQGLDQGLDSFALTARDAPRLTKVTPGWGEPSRWHFGTLRGTLSASATDTPN